MTEIRNAKLMGGIGAALSMIGGVAILGFAMKVLAVKEIAEALGKEEIFKKYLLGVILWFIGSVGAALWMTGLIGASDIGMILTGTIGVLIVVGVPLLILGGWLMKKSYDMIAEETGVKKFSDAGMAYFLGGLLAVVFIGFLILLIAWILEIVAFFSLPDELEEPEGTALLA
ncbi:hypothetical protein A3L12_05875 [Thermococcus sp. P6]|uniref:DUF996 domain-containing protein n=1 Tax=Thermococcus sp. P6 TaxID=122420 RepID=UPI000B59CFA7|nr:DUF996 domain-containing protein [Thermococcus sp. P6]ASJ10861.1 hypothetical protein A3L12_05875 [Thermococcus sp. P6]